MSLVHLTDNVAIGASALDAITTTTNCVAVGLNTRLVGGVGPGIALTGDIRRYPDCGDAVGVLISIGWLDDDLRQAVLAAFTTTHVDSAVTSITAWDNAIHMWNYDPDAFWAWLHTFDAAIDEQDRRMGRTPTPVTRER